MKSATCATLLNFDSCPPFLQPTQQRQRGGSDAGQQLALSVLFVAFQAALHYAELECVSVGLDAQHHNHTCAIAFARIAKL